MIIILQTLTIKTENADGVLSGCVGGIFTQDQPPTCQVDSFTELIRRDVHRLAHLRPSALRLTPPYGRGRTVGCRRPFAVG
ncbi:hypothetical protein GCM10010387_50320 [Streptomyces inusitatus]|uniref:Uncharacterized protein n=1 Tax=Streptomyces inusitatus TaxID=68221 RepID=A0A918QHB0_9ACTN|nr:hypothetical protein GCM10010387_50320 [Streptomyces inusitatus]